MLASEFAEGLGLWGQSLKHKQRHCQSDGLQI